MNAATQRDPEPHRCDCPVHERDLFEGGELSDLAFHCDVCGETFHIPTRSGDRSGIRHNLTFEAPHSY